MEMLKRGQGIQEHHQNSRSEKIKGKLDENGQFDRQGGQLSSQNLVNPNNLCSINIIMPPFSDDHNVTKSDIPPGDDENRGREDIDVIL